jgi:hypothetical protein
MLDDVAGMRDHAGDQQFTFGQPHPLPDVILMFMPRVRRLEAERTGVRVLHAERVL